MEARFVICLSNEGFEAALEPMKIYRSVQDLDAENEGLVRVIDESGEDYLYPATMFEPITVPDRAAKTFAVAG